MMAVHRKLEHSRGEALASPRFRDLPTEGRPRESGIGSCEFRTHDTTQCGLHA
jgi:hypothetical protein